MAGNFKNFPGYERAPNVGGRVSVTGGHGEAKRNISSPRYSLQYRAAPSPIAIQAKMQAKSVPLANPAAQRAQAARGFVVSTPAQRGSASIQAKMAPKYATPVLPPVQRWMKHGQNLPVSPRTPAGGIPVQARMAPYQMPDRSLQRANVVTGHGNSNPHPNFQYSPVQARMNVKAVQATRSSRAVQPMLPFLGGSLLRTIPKAPQIAPLALGSMRTYMTDAQHREYESQEIPDKVQLRVQSYVDCTFTSKDAIRSIASTAVQEALETHSNSSHLSLLMGRVHKFFEAKEVSVGLPDVPDHLKKIGPLLATATAETIGEKGLSHFREGHHSIALLRMIEHQGKPHVLTMDPDYSVVEKLASIPEMSSDEREKLYRLRPELKESKRAIEAAKRIVAAAETKKVPLAEANFSHQELKELGAEPALLSYVPLERLQHWNLAWSNASNGPMLSGGVPGMFTYLGSRSELEKHKARLVVPELSHESQKVHPVQQELHKERSASVGRPPHEVHQVHPRQQEHHHQQHQAQAGHHEHHDPHGK